ncbi:MAG: EamA family transporter [Solirubrobacterales bacterium]|nr:EamA family transporter [Solirubrobacterales bacterium]
MSRPVVISLYALLVVVWSSTWVAIKLGLDDVPPLLGAGVRFAAAGLLLLGIAALRGRSLRTDRRLAALLAVLPFAASYGLIYWAEQYVPSGLAAVLFGVMPLYVALLASLLLRDEPVGRGLVGGLLVAVAGLALAFSESLALGDDDKAGLGAAAMLVAPLAAAAGNVGIRRRGAGLDAVVLNGWAALGAGGLLLATSALGEDWGGAAWTGQAIGATAYLAVLGTALPFTVLTILLRELGAVTMSYLPLLLPFGALLLGAAIEDEALTVPAAAGAALVASGIVVAQRNRRLAVRREEAAAAAP